MQRGEVMDEHTLQTLSKALTHMVFRNGVVEHLHAEGIPLANVAIKKLNQDVNNRFYSLLNVRYNGTADEMGRLEKTLSFLANFYGRNWDPATQVEILIRQ